VARAAPPSASTAAAAAPSRRSVLGAPAAAAALAAAITVGQSAVGVPAAQAKKLSGFNVVKDTGEQREIARAGVVGQPTAAPSPLRPPSPRPPLSAGPPPSPPLPAGDKYLFVYPSGWQEVEIDGVDAIYKDVIEPLETVAVTLLPTEKDSIRDFGSPADVAETFSTKVLSNRGQIVVVQASSEIVKDGRPYYSFEFTAQNERPAYLRHALACVTVGNGQLYTIVTGANDRRWGKMESKLRNVIDSFQLIYDGAPEGGGRPIGAMM